MRGISRKLRTGRLPTVGRLAWELKGTSGLITPLTQPLISEHPIAGGRCKDGFMHAETDVDWMAKGLCADMDPDIFFPEDGMGVLAAQAVCRKCPVKEQCLDYALDTRQEHGVWGGVSERERRRIRRRRRQD